MDDGFFGDCGRTYSVRFRTVPSDFCVLVLLCADAVQSVGRFQEHSAERRLYSGHPPRESHGKLPEKDIQPHHLIRRDLSFAGGVYPRSGVCVGRPERHACQRVFHHRNLNRGFGSHGIRKAVTGADDDEKLQRIFEIKRIFSPVAYVRPLPFGKSARSVGAAERKRVGVSARLRSAYTQRRAKGKTKRRSNA